MIDEYLSQVAQSGLLGVLLVISYVVVFFLYKEAKGEREQLKLERNERLADLKLYSSEDKMFIKEIKVILTQLLESVDKGDK